jgi:glycosyltransferase involved in cell wall biosynthesis
LGMIEGKVKWGAYYAAAVFILPSHQENFGLVVAEALSTSTAVLITNKVNIWSQIDDAGAGYVENDDFEGVSRLLGRWSALTTDQKTEMGSRAKSCYQVNFSVEAAAVDLERLLLDATSIEYGDGVG